MADRDFQIKLSRPHVFLLRMLLFLTLVGYLGLILYEQFNRVFVVNLGLNWLMLLVLGVGMLYGFRQALRLYPDIR